MLTVKGGDGAEAMPQRSNPIAGAPDPSAGHHLWVIYHAGLGSVFARRQSALGQEDDPVWTRSLAYAFVWLDPAGADDYRRRYLPDDPDISVQRIGIDTTWPGL